MAEASFDAVDEPMAFTALTVKLYVTPLVRPVTVQCDDPEAEEHDPRLPAPTAVVDSPPELVPW